MNINKRTAISTSATVAIIVVILVIAGVAAYFVLTPSSPTKSTTTTTTSGMTTTTTTPSHTTTSTSGMYGPKNSSQFIDESQGVAYDSMDPQYAFYLQDVAMLNAVYQNLVELNGTQGNTFQWVLASSGNMKVNNGLTNTFNLRTDVTFSNGDHFQSADVWFSIVRDLFMNAPSGIAPFNWASVLYNISANSGPYVQADEYTDNYCWNTVGLGVPAGLADAVNHVTGLAVNSETAASCDLLASVMTQMLSNFNPSNMTQEAIMAYPNQAVVSPTASTFTANYLHPLGAFGLNLWSGFDGQNVVDPAQIDAHGGVVNNTLNNYVNLNGGIGTGPYYVKSVGAGLAPVVFQAVPNYWGATDSAVTGNKSMTDAQKAIIPTIIYEVPPTDTAKIEDFATNTAQFGAETISEWGQLFNAFHHNEPTFSFNQVLCSTACSTNLWPFGSWFLMNSVQAPTNNTHFRLGWQAAINYTEMNAPNYYQGTAYAYYFVGALTPGFGSYYNPDNYSPPSQDLTTAFNEFMTAGQQNHWYTVTTQQIVTTGPATLSNGTTVPSGTALPAGTVIGDANGQQLSPVKVYYTVPLLSELQGVLQGIFANLQVFGISATAVGITSAESNILTGTPSTFPEVELLGWGPDYADPFLAMYEPLLLPSPYNGWYNNQTVINDVNSCLFPVGAQVQSCSQLLERDTVQNAVFPTFYNFPLYYYFVQPYVHGLVNNPFVGYWYNELFYTPVAT